MVIQTCVAGGRWAACGMHFKALMVAPLLLLSACSVPDEQLAHEDPSGVTVAEFEVAVSDVAGSALSGAQVPGTELAHGG